MILYLDMEKRETYFKRTHTHWHTYMYANAGLLYYFSVLSSSSSKIHKIHVAFFPTNEDDFEDIFCKRGNDANERREKKSRENAQNTSKYTKYYSKCVLKIVIDDNV